MLLSLVGPLFMFFGLLAALLAFAMMAKDLLDGTAPLNVFTCLAVAAVVVVVMTFGTFFFLSL